MSGKQVLKDSTNVSVTIRIIDSTDGSPEQAVEHDTAGIALWYRRELAAKTTITPAALAALTTAHTDGGIEHIDDGYYRLDVPDAAFATGVDSVMIGGTVTGMIILGQEISLVDYDPEDATRLGLTALPNAAADAAGGLPISDAGGQDIDAAITSISAIETDTNELQGDWANGGRLDLLLDAVATTADLLDKVGAVSEAAATGDPSATESVMQYVKQIVNILAGTAGITTMPAAAAPANGVSVAEMIRAIYDDTNEVQTDLADGGRLDLIIDIIAADVVNLDGAAMRGTDNAALASVLGALNDAAAAGDPTASDTLMQYMKQLVNVLVGTTGITTWPAEAAPANNVSLAEAIRAIAADVTGLNGDAMRGTDNAALASVVGALADAAAAGDPTSADTLMQYTKQLINVLVGTTGIATWPASAAPANAVNIAEALRAVYDDTNEIGAAGAGLTDLGGMSTNMKNEVNAEVDSSFTTQMADSVVADGTIATREQALYQMLQFLTERSVSGTTVTVKKVDGSTSLFTLTLDDATTPTSITRS